MSLGQLAGVLNIMKAIYDYGIVCQLLQYCDVVYRVLKSQLKVLILIMLCLVNISLCCMRFKGFNLCFICLFRPV